MFKAATPKNKPTSLFILKKNGSQGDNSRPSSTKSDSVLTLLMRRDALKQQQQQPAENLVPGATTRAEPVRSSSANDPVGWQKPTKQNVVKSIQNVTMKTSGNNQILLSTNSERSMSGNLVDGPFVNKLSKPAVITRNQSTGAATLGVRTQQQPLANGTGGQPSNNNVVVTTVVSSPHLVTMTSSINGGRKLVNAPIPIASKPIVAQAQAVNSNTVTPHNNNTTPQVLKLVSPQIISVQGSTGGQTPTGGATVPIQSILVPTATSQYGTGGAGGIALLNSATMVTKQQQQTVTQTGIQLAAAATQQVQQQASQQQPTMLTGIVVRPPHQNTAAVVQQPQLVAINQVLPTTFFVPTAATTGGANKVQHVAQMILPGTPLNAGKF